MKNPIFEINQLLLPNWVPHPSGTQEPKVNAECRTRWTGRNF
jgi:hypothetical protein